MLELHLMSCYQKFNYVNGLNDFNDVTFAFDDVLSRREKNEKNMLKYIRFAFDNVLSKVNYVNG